MNLKITSETISYTSKASVNDASTSEHLTLNGDLVGSDAIVKLWFYKIDNKPKDVTDRIITARQYGYIVSDFVIPDETFNELKQIALSDSVQNQNKVTAIVMAEKLTADTLNSWLKEGKGGPVESVYADDIQIYTSRVGAH